MDATHLHAGGHAGRQLDGHDQRQRGGNKFKDLALNDNTARGLEAAGLRHDDPGGTFGQHGHLHRSAVHRLLGPNGRLQRLRRPGLRDRGQRPGGCDQQGRQARARLPSGQPWAGATIYTTDATAQTVDPIGFATSKIITLARLLAGRRREDHAEGRDRPQCRRASTWKRRSHHQGQRVGDADLRLRQPHRWHLRSDQGLQDHQRLPEVPDGRHGRHDLLLRRTEVRRRHGRRWRWRPIRATPAPAPAPASTSRARASASKASRASGVGRRRSYDPADAPTRSPSSSRVRPARTGQAPPIYTGSGVKPVRLRLADQKMVTLRVFSPAAGTKIRSRWRAPPTRPSHEKTVTTTGQRVGDADFRLRVPRRGCIQPGYSLQSRSASSRSCPTAQYHCAGHDHVTLTTSSSPPSTVAWAAVVAVRSTVQRRLSPATTRNGGAVASFRGSNAGRYFDSSVATQQLRSRAACAAGGATRSYYYFYYWHRQRRPVLGVLPAPA